MQINNLTYQSNVDIKPDFNKENTITLNCGDSKEFLKTIPSDSIDLIITSPPYNIGKEYEQKRNIDYYLSNQDKTINELVRILKVTGNLCWQVGNFVDNGEIYPLDILFYDLFKSKGLKMRNRIIWYFAHGLHAQKRFSGRYETIMWFSKSDTYKFNLDEVRVPSKYPGKLHFKGPKKGQPSGNPLGKNPSDIWEIVATDWENEIWNIPNCKSNHPEKTIHPCSYPIELVERCVLALTDKDDIVLDPYCGVGSSLIAGLLHDRKVVGIDKEQEYLDITKERIYQFYNGGLKKRPMTKLIYQPTGKEKVSQVPKEWLNLFNEK
jgi:DNA modification methylase